MKNLSIFLCFLLSTLATVAQPPKGMGQSDPAAKKVLDGVSNKFKTYKTVEAVFQLKIENATGKSLGAKSGTVYMKGTKYRISITGQEMFCDGSNIWNYDKAANEVTISKIDPTANSITPQKLFTNFYDKDFLYKLNGTVKEGGKNTQEIELTPVDKTKPFFKVLLYIENATIWTTRVMEKNGSKFTYAVSSMKTGKTIGDEMFVFDAKKYPGVEVVDLR